MTNVLELDDTVRRWVNRLSSAYTVKEELDRPHPRPVYALTASAIYRESAYDIPGIDEVLHLLRCWCQARGFPGPLYSQAQIRKTVENQSLRKLTLQQYNILLGVVQTVVNIVEGRGCPPKTEVVVYIPDDLGSQHYAEALQEVLEQRPEAYGPFKVGEVVTFPVIRADEIELFDRFAEHLIFQKAEPIVQALDQARAYILSRRQTIAGEQR